MEKIQRENLALLGRLEDSKPVYSALKMKQERRKVEGYLKNLMPSPLPASLRSPGRSTASRSRVGFDENSTFSNPHRPGKGSSKLSPLTNRYKNGSQLQAYLDKRSMELERDGYIEEEMGELGEDVDLMEEGKISHAVIKNLLMLSYLVYIFYSKQKRQS